MEKTFVSRAGAKLEHALGEFGIDVTGKICADLGCSTGGFTDCLLQSGAAKVYSVDTGYGVLEWKLRKDPRVITMERKNAMHVELPEKMDFISVDVSWTRQALIIPHALELLKTDGDIVTLIKPHYEAEKHMLTSGRVKPEYLESILKNTENHIQELGVKIVARTVSPVLGEKGGNIEYLFWIKPA